MKALYWLAIVVGILMFITSTGYVLAVYLNERSFVFQSHWGAVIQLAVSVTLVFFGVSKLRDRSKECQ